MKPTASVLFGLVPSFVLGALLALWRPGPLLPEPVRQPIEFNHRKHVKELELTCATCHATVETEAFSSLPAADVCAGCHAEAQGKSEEEKKLVALLSEGKPLLWAPLFRQPAHVFYSHRRHVVSGKIPCETCHGAIGASSAPPGHVKKLLMDDCLACHVARGVSTDCTTCHR